jgi:hypothetical protein
MGFAIVIAIGKTDAQTPVKSPLLLEAKIPLGDVRGRIDHMAVDLARQRLFVAELENDSVAIVDLKRRQVIHTISGLREPQGIGYLQSMQTFYVANRRDGSLRVFSGADYAAAGQIDLGENADNVRADAATNEVFVGYGNGALAVILLFVPLPALVAQEALAPYCADLKRVADMATTKGRFASISAQPREGNFTDTSLILPGWNDCSVYAGRIYTCDSKPAGTAQEARQAQEKISGEVQACLGPSWAEAKDRSSLGFVVLHHTDRPISITLSIDQPDEKNDVVRLILFAGAAEALA